MRFVHTEAQPALLIFSETGEVMYVVVTAVLPQNGIGVRKCGDYLRPGFS